MKIHLEGLKELFFSSNVCTSGKSNYNFKLDQNIEYVFDFNFEVKAGSGIFRIYQLEVLDYDLPELEKLHVEAKKLQNFKIFILFQNPYYSLDFHAIGLDV